MSLFRFLPAMFLIPAACVAPSPSTTASPMVNNALGTVAERYVKLVLDIGQQDEGYVDAYYGPAEWQTAAAARKVPLEQLAVEAAALRTLVAAVDVSGSEDIVKLRKEYLDKQLVAVATRIAVLRGQRFTFDEESRALYDAVSPRMAESERRAILDSLSAAVPGSAPLAQRVEAFRREFIIPPARLDTVFRAAIAEARRRTAARLTLPANENFVLEYVKDKPWSGYNWYKGNAQSLIQINTELPIFIDRAIDLAAHEGYPGHHVYNALLEQRLVRDRGWVEFTVYPLFSPMSLIAEGSANYGIEVAFPGNERIEFEKRVLFPLAGLDPARAEQYYRVQRLGAKLTYVGNDVARDYLDGRLDREQAAQRLVSDALSSIERARQRVRFFDTYRSYVINYNLGKDLVRDWVERQGGTDANPERRWKVFESLLSSPRLPSGLR
jgi:hypothetical protein